MESLVVSACLTTAEQRGAALVLAREIFSRHGIREALLPKVRAD